MAIGKHEPVQSAKVAPKDALGMLLEEALVALEECFHDLSDAQIAAKPLPGRHNIATLVGHLLMSADMYAAHLAAGKMSMEHQPRFDIWKYSEEQLRDQQGNLPTRDELLTRLRSLRETALAYVKAAGEADLRSDRNLPEWYRARGRTQTDSILRLIGHVQAHVRQVWLCRGAMGLKDTEGWPQQHLA
jgi:hypothetical protein